MSSFRVVLGALVLTVAGCEPPPPKVVVPAAPVAKASVTAEPTPPPAAPTAPETHVIHLHGSNTLGFGCVPRLAKAFLEKQGALQVYVNEESRAKERVWVQARIGNPAREISIEIYAPGTKVGFDSLDKGFADVVMASRPATDAETKSEPVETVVAMDGIAVIVNPKNKVAQLNIKQLAGIFAKETKTWASVPGAGGANQPIHTLSRDEKSGTLDGFTSLVMRGKAIRADQTFEDNEALVDAVMKDETAIGFVGLPYVHETKALAIQDGNSRFLPPTAYTVATEDYPLSRRLFFYSLAQPKEPLVKDFLDFAVSDAGQTIVTESGLVPLAVHADSVQAQIPASAPPRYTKLVTGSTRLSVLRFKAGTDKLDSKAKIEMERLMRHVNSPINRGRHVTLVGFTDGAGQAEDANEKSSKARADTVASILGERGLTIAPTDVVGLGSALPVAPNDSKEGRAKNRRVEVWLH